MMMRTRERLAHDDEDEEGEAGAPRQRGQVRDEGEGQ